MKKLIIASTMLPALVALSACAEASDDSAATDDGVETVADGEPVTADPTVSTGDNSANLPVDDNGNRIRVDSDGVSAELGDGNVRADIDADGDDSLEVEF